ncbi:MAG: histidine--tRNA ligase [Candidatus Eisenbacteria bacterium]|nr:histidine--tRNA ligase [Candidatus Eisenbacteria bacterium]
MTDRQRGEGAEGGPAPGAGAPGGGAPAGAAPKGAKREKIQAPRGTHDILPPGSGRWAAMERRTQDLMRRFGFEEIRTPVFEELKLFVRGVGEGSDIVRKEMYDFKDKGGRDLALRPEGTASVARAAVEHGLLQPGRVVKLWYQGPMFRYDRPAAGRYRQFHQMGVEVLGSASPLADLEAIQVFWAWLMELGLTGLTLKLNSVGCPVCRPVYRERLREFLAPRLERLCGDCRERYERNPMRVLDCKVPSCREQLAGAPAILDSLGEECRTHFDELRAHLDSVGLPHVIDTGLVRGLDYYTKTAFEVHDDALGAQSAVGGGGRYDGLVEEVGGPPTPGVGFSTGLERVLLSMEAGGSVALAPVSRPEYFVATVDAAARPEALRLLAALRARHWAEADLSGSSLKAQFRRADSLKAAKVVVLGPEEIARGVARVKDMDTHEEKEVPLEELRAR